MTNLKTMAAVAIGLATSMVASQAAVQINGTLGIVPMGNVTFTGASLGSATSITAPSWEVVNSIPTTYNASNNDFNLGPGQVAPSTAVTISPLTLNFPVGVLPAYMTFAFQSASANYVFDLNTLTVTSSDPNSISLSGSGILYDTGSPNNWAPTPTLFSASFNTTGTGAANGSFTLSTIPVPEPSTYIAGLGALALFGFTAIPKRKVVK